jgi:periplasmic protein TonB
MAHKKLLYKNPEIDLRNKYPKWMEMGIIIALALITILFYAFKDFNPSSKLEKKLDITIENVEIPQTEQIQRPPPPARPSIPIESEDEDIPDDLTIEETEVNFSESVDELPPPEEEEPIVPFFALSEKPKVVKQGLPIYPELARKAGIEGRVTVEVVISTKGDVEQVKIVKGHPMLDDAALEAAKKWKFSPGKQRDRFVKVRMTIPIDFKLKR